MCIHFDSHTRGRDEAASIHIYLLIIREDNMELSDSGRQQKPASSRMLDDGITSGSKEMVGGSAVATSSSRDIMRRLLRADLILTGHVLQ